MEITRLNITDYEQVVHFMDETSGLNAIIAVHNTKLGPAIGGCRMYAYETFEDALQDVLNLSRGMTSKNALAGLKFGGGKSVIIGGSELKSEDLFLAFGDALNYFNGKYYTGEDVGISVEDVDIMRRRSKFAAGTDRGGKGSGDPSPFTAYGVFLGIQEAVKARLGQSGVRGVRVAVSGLGHVGFEVCRLLHAAGASLIVADINDQVLKQADEIFGATIVDYHHIHAVDANVYTPCALGGAINPDTIHDLKCEIVAGAANNQLMNTEMGDELHRRRILYAPDYVINAGGVVSVAHEVMGDWSRDAVREQTREISKVLNNIFRESREKDCPTSVIADHMVERLLSKSGDDPHLGGTDWKESA